MDMTLELGKPFLPFQQLKPSFLQPVKSWCPSPIRSSASASSFSSVRTLSSYDSGFQRCSLLRKDEAKDDCSTSALSCPVTTSFPTSSSTRAGRRYQANAALRNASITRGVRYGMVVLSSAVQPQEAVAKSGMHDGEACAEHRTTMTASGRHVVQHRSEADLCSAGGTAA
ncbi:hypothetical protein HPB51_024949 [Rhipicephalus microplus]|uniref:Uncharacterized protein n=1 Tax=Rhipicephalus microplus TaxID=6941 RepID=A0A9J6EJE4_RHIMP|nr:hypothetical protein HPB51_024949 [Rhipicephalus microplus]